MNFLNTNPKRKSAVITAIILILLLFAIFNFGMRYLDPPQEYGLAINFGNSDIGSGEFVEKTKKESVVPQEVEKKVIEKIEETSPKITEEKIITNTTSKEISVVKTKPKEISPKKKEIKEKPKPQKIKPKPKPLKATEDALNNLLNGNASDGEPKGEGDDNKQGIKGTKNGDPNASKYYGNSGSGGGGNYNLSGRKALFKPIKKPNCEEEGTVVVSIEVNKEGKVIKAIAGVKGSTNTAPCLLKPARDAALNTKWNLDLEAPEKQKGTIIYRFSLSK